MMAAWFSSGYLSICEVKATLGITSSIDVLQMVIRFKNEHKLKNHFVPLPLFSQENIWTIPVTDFRMLSTSSLPRLLL